MSRAARYGRRRKPPPVSGPAPVGALAVEEITNQIEEKEIEAMSEMENIATETTIETQTVPSGASIMPDVGGNEAPLPTESYPEELHATAGTVYTGVVASEEEHLRRLSPVVPEHHHAGRVISGQQQQTIDARPLLTYLWAETDRATSEVADPSKETTKTLGALDALRAVTRQVTKMALGMTE